MPARDDSIIMNAVTIVFFSLATVCLILRILARSHRRFELIGYDDLAIFLSWVAGAPLIVVQKLLTDNGLGRDLWNVSFDQVTRMMFWYWLAEFLYLYCTILMKVSILLFYLRVFTDPLFKKQIYLLLTLNALVATAYTFVVLFQCTPISHAWTFWDNQAQGHCINLTAGLSSSAAVNMLLDLAVLLLPLPQLLNLQLSYSWKIQAQIFGMFSVGILVTVVSAIRLKTLITLAKSRNVTYDFLPAGYWSAIEMYVGICCACLPSVRIFLTRVLPKWMGWEKPDAYAYGASVKPVAGWKSPNKSREDKNDFLPLTDVSERTSTGVREAGASGQIVRTDTYHVFAKEIIDEQGYVRNDPFRCAGNQDSFRRRTSLGVEGDKRT